MTENGTNKNQQKLNTGERFALTGHCLIAAGGLLLSMSQIVMIASSGKISDFGGCQPTSFGRTPAHQNQNSYDGLTANDYFRRG